MLDKHYTTVGVGSQVNSFEFLNIFNHEGHEGHEDKDIYRWDRKMADKPPEKVDSRKLMLLFGVFDVTLLLGFLHKKKMNFFNLSLALCRLSYYSSCFSGVYSSISQEYPPIN